MIVGSFGMLVFEVASRRLATWETLSLSASRRYADHEPVVGKPVDEAGGLSLKAFDLSVIFARAWGVEPREESRKLFELLDGDPQRLIIGDENFGPCTLRDVSQQWENCDKRGNPAVVRASLKFVEHNETRPTTGTERLRRDEEMRPQTGRGGPRRLPGDSSRKKSPAVPEMVPIPEEDE